MPDEANSEQVAAEQEPAPTPPAAGAVPVEPGETGYTPEGIPTFESVREKIETR